MIDLSYLQIRLWSSPWECRWISIIVIVASRIVTLLTQSINFQDFICVQTHFDITINDWSSLFYFLILVKLSFSFVTSVQCSNRKINIISFDVLDLYFVIFFFSTDMIISFSCHMYHYLSRVRTVLDIWLSQEGTGWGILTTLSLSPSPFFLSLALPFDWQSPLSVMMQ